MLLLSRKRRAKELDDVVVKLRGQRVARSDKVKYLGVWVDEGLTWKDHIDAVRRKCCWGLAKLRRHRWVAVGAGRNRWVNEGAKSGAE